MKVKRALLSVSDKTGLVEFARALSQAGVEILSTGGTAKILREHGLAPIELSEFTGFPEMLDGRVKTLHPKVHGGLLYLRGNPDHEAQAKAHDIRPIDLVAVNLYPFEATIQKPGIPEAEAIEHIDIGGPSMLRSAAKNFASVIVVCDPSDYASVAAAVATEGGPSFEARRALAVKVFQHTSYYDAVIAQHFAQSNATEPAFPSVFAWPLRLAQGLRYGENPHQKAALYGSFADRFEQLHGKELSYNNLIDLSAAAHLILEFNEPSVAILKHTNPCGVATAADLRTAWDHAFATDRQAPFGGIIAVNRPLDAPVAEAIADIFSEVILAPDFKPDALDILKKKKNLRLLRFSGASRTSARWELRSVLSGVLLQSPDQAHDLDPAAWSVVTRRQPSPEEQRALQFNWRVVKHVKSNAVVYGGPDRTLGIGAGQMSRVDSSKIAVWKASEAGLSLVGSVVASDAFFPFPDGVVAAAEAGATAVVQPGGSLRDAEVIAACNERDVAMVFTKHRHFRH